MAILVDLGLNFCRWKIIGYTSDTGLFENMGSLYQGCDVLVLNCLKLKPDNFNKHLSVDDSIQLLKVVNQNSQY